MVIAYIRNLPLDSPTVARLRGGEQYQGWDTHMYMLANVVDALQDNTYAFVSAHSKRKPKAPPRIERPAAKKKKDPANNKFMAQARMAYKVAHKPSKEGR